MNGDVLSNLYIDRNAHLDHVDLPKTRFILKKEIASQKNTIGICNNHRCEASLHSPDGSNDRIIEIYRKFASMTLRAELKIHVTITIRVMLITESHAVHAVS